MLVFGSLGKLRYEGITVCILLSMVFRSTGLILVCVTILFQRVFKWLYIMETSDFSFLRPFCS